MKVLLDTHTFLWWITNKLQLISPRVQDLVQNRDNELFFSAASGWEIALKAQIGRLKLPDDPDKFIAEQLSLNAIQALPIQLSHALHTYNLPAHHRDPFDRVLVAQSQLERLPIVTKNPQIARYNVKVIW